MQLVDVPEPFFFVFLFFSVGWDHISQPKVILSQYPIEEKILVEGMQLVDVPGPFFFLLFLEGGTPTT